MPMIHAHIWNPAAPSIFVKAKKSDRAEFHTVTCSSSARCEVFARGECIARQFMGSGCLHGSAHVERGPTQRAGSFYTWLSEKRKAAEGVGTLKMPTDRLARVVNSIWLPYSHMDYVLEGFGEGKGRFLPVERFTADMIVRLCEARPQAYFGGEITPYQRTSIPLFIAHLSETFPALLAEAAPNSPRIQAVLSTLTKVGRKAKLVTLLPGTIGGWTWDGTYMTTSEPGGKFEAREVRILPGPDAVVTVPSDAMVSPRTVFVD